MNKEMTNEEHTEHILNIIRSQEKRKKIKGYNISVCSKTKNTISLTFTY